MKERGIKLALLGLAAITGFSAAVMFIWNWLMPSIFGLVTIGFWQALGMLVLARILFGGIGGGRAWMAGGMHANMRDHNPIREKWMKMTPEERKEFIKNRHRHFPGNEYFGRPPFDMGDEPKKEE